MGLFHDDFSVDRLADYIDLSQPPYNFGVTALVTGGHVMVPPPGGAGAEIYGLIAGEVEIVTPTRVSAMFFLDTSEAGEATPGWQSFAENQVGLSDIAWSWNPFAYVDAIAPTWAGGVIVDNGSWHLGVWGDSGPVTTADRSDIPVPSIFWITFDWDGGVNIAGGMWSAAPPDDAFSGVPDLLSVAATVVLPTDPVHPYLDGHIGLLGYQDDWKATANIGTPWTPKWPYEAPTITAVQGDGGVMRFTAR